MDAKYDEGDTIEDGYDSDMWHIFAVGLLCLGSSFGLHLRWEGRRKDGFLEEDIVTPT